MAKYSITMIIPFSVCGTTSQNMLYFAKFKIVEIVEICNE